MGAGLSIDSSLARIRNVSNLLNESAGTVSWVLQDLLLNDVKLSISKLADPAGDGNRRNRLALRWGGRPSEQFRASSDEV
jgi:hypothetical protein